MALAVIDTIAHKRKIRVAFNTDKLAREVEMPRDCTPECAGPRGCIVRAGLARAHEHVLDFALTWASNDKTEHPEWLVYIHEVTSDEPKAKAKGRKAKAKRPAARRRRRAQSRA